MNVFYRIAIDWSNFVIIYMEVDYIKIVIIIAGL